MGTVTLATMDAWATARDLAAMYQVPRGTIYAWASLDHWHRTTTIPRRYGLSDAQASYERRRERATLTQVAHQRLRWATVQLPAVCPDGFCAVRGGAVRQRAGPITRNDTGFKSGPRHNERHDREPSRRRPDRPDRADSAARWHHRALPRDQRPAWHVADLYLDLGPETSRRR